MIDPQAWPFVILIALFMWTAVIARDDMPKKSKTTCDKHPGAAYCKCRGTLPKGKK